VVTAPEPTPIYDEVVGALLVDPVKLTAEIDAEMTALRNPVGALYAGAVELAAADTGTTQLPVADPPTEEIPAVAP
jgi:hypothetical protein